MAEQIKNRLDPTSLGKIGKGACIAGGAVAILYFLQGVTKLDFGVATPLVVGVLSIFINFIKEWKKGIVPKAGE